MSKIYPIIMSGGAGSRLWPLSRRECPKQFLPLVEDMTLLQATAQRLRQAPGSLDIAGPIIICGKGQEGMARHQLQAMNMPPSAIIIEPEGRNTAAVAAVAAHYVRAIDPDGYVLLLSADHHVANPEGFWTGVEQGLPAARDGKLVTLGIEATRPDTGYGYIQQGDELYDDVYKIAQFVEKPDAETARSYLDQGGYYWNAGIFLFHADTMLGEFERHAPQISATCLNALEAGQRSGDMIWLAPDVFATCDAAPVDTVIMEPTQESAVVAPVRAGWSDIGSWKALSDIRQDMTGDANNEIGDVLTLGCEDCHVQSDGPLVAAIGLKDIVIVASGDTVLVVHKDKTQDVKKIVEALKKDGRTDKL